MAASTAFLACVARRPARDSSTDPPLLLRFSRFGIRFIDGVPRLDTGVDGLPTALLFLIRPPPLFSSSRFHAFIYKGTRGGCHLGLVKVVYCCCANNSARSRGGASLLSRTGVSSWRWLWNRCYLPPSRGERRGGSRGNMAVEEKKCQIAGENKDFGLLKILFIHTPTPPLNAAFLRIGMHKQDKDHLDSKPGLDPPSPCT